MTKSSAKKSIVASAGQDHGGQKLRLWLVEDHVIFRDLLADYLSSAAEVK